MNNQKVTTIGNSFSLSRIIKYGVLVLSLGMSYSLVQNIIEIRGSGQEIEAVKSRLEQVQLEREKAEEELSYVMSDAFTENQGRDRLGLSGENEVVVVLPDEDILRRIAPRPKLSTSDQLPDPYWKKWLNLFL